LGDFAPGETKQVSIKFQQSQLKGLSSDTSGGVNARGYPYPGVTTTIGVYSADTTVEEIVGTINYYDDRESFIRYSLVASLAAQWNGTLPRGGGFYLSAWANTSPVAIDIPGKTPQYNDRTLYLVRLYPEQSPASGEITYTPAMFTWDVYAVAPYNVSLPAGEYALQFALTNPTGYQRVKSLILHIRYPINNQPAAELALWDFNENNWSPLPSYTWGDNDIPAPERFVGPGGVIRLRISNPSPGGITIEASDFTLVVER
jgi:hypothetical protein